MEQSRKRARLNSYLQPADNNLGEKSSLARTPALPEFGDVPTPSSSLLSELEYAKAITISSSPTPTRTLRRKTPSDVPGPSFVEVIGTEIVYFFVGPERIEFTAHKNLVCNASAVLKRMLERKRSEDEYFLDLNELFLPESAHRAVQAFVTFLYRDRKEVIALAPSRSYKDYIDLYIFGAAYAVNTLKDIAMDGIQDQLKLQRKSLTDGDIENIFARTAENDKLRKFCAALITHELLRHKNRTPSEVHSLMVKVPDLLRVYLVYQHTESPEPPIVPMYQTMGNDPRDRVGFRDSGHSFHVCSFHVHDILEECLTEPNC